MTDRAPSTVTLQELPIKEVDLDITGMTCASCSARIERKLNKVEGIDATVNLATEKAHVTFSGDHTPDEIIDIVKTTGYGASVAVPRHARGTDHDHDVAPAQSLLRRLIVSAILAVPVVILAMVPGMDFTANPWVQFLLTTPIVVWAAWPFHRAAAINARHGASTMDTLVSVGVFAAYGWSTVSLIGQTVRGDLGMGMGHYYFETAAVITTFLLFGRWLEARAKDRGRSAMTTLMELGAKDVAVQRIDATTRVTTEIRIPIEQLRVGEHFVVRPGEKVATDGVVTDGTSAIDSSLVTGESVPVDVGPGTAVTGGTLNTTGRLVVEATQVGEHTVLAGITRLVEQAQTGKADVQRLADRVSAVFVPVVLVLALLTFVGWWIGTGDASTALSVAVAVLIIACPCALGLATPTAMVAGTGRGAQLGVLIKGPQVLEDTRRIDTVLLDKTGTVTTGRPVLTHVVTSGNLTEESALQTAAAVESGSEHPIARAIVDAAEERGLEIPQIRDFQALPGTGARALIKDTGVSVGRASLFGTVPEELTNLDHPGTTVYVGWGDKARAALTVADDVRDTSAQAIADLHAQGLAVYLLTGDAQAPATAVAAEVGIPADRVFAGVRPEDKHAVVAKLQSEGHVVAMVGDGINDAPALAQADLGVAMGGGTDAAMASADIVLMRSELPAVVDAIGLSRRTLSIIKQNLVWAFGYNTAAIPLAMAGLLNPMIAGAAMAMSSVLVVTNSLRLRGYGRR
ncbi:heavy metal translocating P-type ATPase [Kribbia dieselivorans]|uniref:heavy metal translocating P-type ATPase n=1 Tax=Kribbia dieselivorans TaxID=331526 RepID=UPI000A68B99D|nr:heavy metal translocating P-type ATPase [Kribbia dieselivorans]